MPILPHEIKLIIVEQYVKDLMEQIALPLPAEITLLKQWDIVRLRKRQRIQLVLDGVLNLIYALPALRDDICRFLLHLRHSQRQASVDNLNRWRADFATVGRNYTLLQWQAETMRYFVLRVQYQVLLYVYVAVYPGWPKYVTVTRRYTSMIRTCLRSHRQIEAAKGRRRASV